MIPEKRENIIPKAIRIGKDVWIGSNAVILPGVTVGDGAVIAAGAVVTKNVETDTVVGGRPAEVFAYNKMYKLALLIYMHENNGVDTVFIGVMDSLGNFIW